MKLRDGVSTAEVDYGTVLLDEDRGEYWNLNETAAQILKTLLAGGSVQDAALRVCDEFDADVLLATRDVEDLVGELRAAGLVET